MASSNDATRTRANPELVALAREHLAGWPSVYFAPSIPPAKEANARRAHEAHLPAGEPILALHDATLFGSAEEGFVLTPERVCWKNFLEHPRQVPWIELDLATVRAEHDRVAVAGGAIHLVGEHTASAARLLGAMARSYFHAAAGPYRSRASEGTSPVARLVQLARRYLGEREHVYYDPAIPPAKLRNARAVHAAHLEPGEPIAVLYDDTLFESARDGFLITPLRLSWRNINGEAAALAWRDILPDQLSVAGTAVHLMGRTIYVSVSADLAARVASLLAVVSREARAEARP